MNVRKKTQLSDQAKDHNLLLFDELIKYKKGVFFVCLGFTRAYFEAEELTQEVYLKTWEKLPDLRDQSLAKTWLFKLTKNLCIDYTRRNKLKELFQIRNNNENIDALTPEKKAINQQEISDIKKIIYKLPLKFKQVFILREYGELSYREITALLKIKRGTVMSRLNRAKQLIIKKTREKNHV